MRVEPGRRLVEEEELRISHQSAGDGESLLLTTRQRSYSRIALLSQLHLVDDHGHIDGVAIEALEKSKRLIDGQLLRELSILELDAEELAEKLTVDETLTLFQSFYRDARDVGEVIDKVELGEKRYSRVGSLSGGQKQRLAVACALVGNPQLLFLDEPTTGLDPQSRRQLWELISKFQAEGRTIVLTTHYMEEAERLCDRVAIVDHGKIIALGSPRDLVESVDVSHLPPPEPRKTSATLEDVFVSLTGRTLRDE